MKLVATFQPEAWFRNNAIQVDPEGETEWDCTAFVEKRGMTEKVTAAIQKDDTFFDRDDVLKYDPAAPDWVKKWNGPFTITVERDEH